MLIVAISGSPRKNGNSENITNNALKYFEKEGHKTEQINLSELNIGPCTHCNFCANKEGKCIQKDDGNNANSIIEKADAILVTSPVYFGSMTGQLKCLFDRTLPLRRSMFKLKGKIGAAITVGGSRCGGQELTIKDIHAWMLVHGMVIVGDNAHFGGTVHNPLEKDEFGNSTINGTLEALSGILGRLK